MLAQSSVKTSKTQRGVALITVLLVFAIASVLVSKILLNNAIDLKRSSGMIERTQAYFYALAGEEAAIRLLQIDHQDDKTKKTGDKPQEQWAQVLPIELDIIGKVHVKIIDLNRFFNVNNLVYEGEKEQESVKRFKELLNKLFIDDRLADNLVDWLDADDEAEGIDSESEYYQKLERPYLAANRQMTDISELLLVKGFTKDIYRQLIPYITAFKLSSGGQYPININTAPAHVLGTVRSSSAADAPFLSIMDAENIRSEPPFDTITAFIDHPVSGQIISASGLSVNSQIFEINIRAEYAGSVVYLTTVVIEGDGLPSGRTKYHVLSRNETDNSSRFIYNE